MPLQRVVKQVSYAGGCALLLLVVIGGIVFLRRGPAVAPTPSPTPISDIKPIAVERVDIIRHPSAVDVVARLRNPNSHAGVPDYPVTFIMLNSAQEEIARQEVTTYLLPGSVQYVVALSVPVGEVVTRVQLENEALPSFTVLPAGLTLPNFGSFLRERSIRQVGADTIEEQKGIVRNNSTFDFQKVQVTALALDAGERVVGVGTTFLGELKVGEQREFTVQWPAPQQTTNDVTTFPSTNVFLEENIIRAIGDPSLLR